MSVLVLVVGLILVLHPLCAIGTTSTQLEVEALSAMKANLDDPNSEIANWDSLLVAASTFWHLDCNSYNSVTRMNLGRQGLSGNLVGEFGNLKSLEHMLLNDNNISGPIPIELGDVKSLLDLDLQNNNLDGSIPASLGNLPKLLYIRLQGNKLNGGIPISFTNLRNLLVLDLSNNKLSGSIPAGLFDKLPNLRYLNLSNNNFTGNVPMNKPRFTVDVTNNGKLVGACTDHACEVV